MKTSGWEAELRSLIYSRLFNDLSLPIKRIGALDEPIPSSKKLEDLVLLQLYDIEIAIKKAVNNN